jgi:hypothetical protein
VISVIWQGRMCTRILPPGQILRLQLCGGPHIQEQGWSQGVDATLACSLLSGVSKPSGAHSRVDGCFHDEYSPVRIASSTCDLNAIFAVTSQPDLGARGQARRAVGVGSPPSLTPCNNYELHLATAALVFNLDRKKTKARAPFLPHLQNGP